MTSQEELQEAYQAEFELVYMMGRENRFFKRKLMELAQPFEEAGEQNPFFYRCALVILEQWYGWEDVYHGEDYREIDEMLCRIRKKYLH